MTIENASEFLREHRRGRLNWEPIGAVQGWNPDTYAEGVAKYMKMGYEHLALGGLVRTTTPEILEILERVHEKLKPGIKLHLFGLARFRSIEQFAKFGVTSVDSASMLRKAWLGSHTNYLTDTGWYSAIRVPQLTSSFRAKRAISNGVAADRIADLEKKCLHGLHRHDRKQGGRVESSLLDDLAELDEAITGTSRKSVRETILRTLEDRPWQKCRCKICQAIGIDVMIFRGNNRNRRRGFHNTYVFYRLIERILNGERVPWLEREAKSKSTTAQALLFNSLSKTTV